MGRLVGEAFAGAGCRKRCQGSGGKEMTNVGFEGTPRCGGMPGGMRRRGSESGGWCSRLHW